MRGTRCIEVRGLQIGTIRPRVGVVVGVQTCLNVGVLLVVVYLAPFEAAPGDLRRVDGAARRCLGRNVAAGAREPVDVEGDGQEVPVAGHGHFAVGGEVPHDGDRGEGGRYESGRNSNDS